jgi:hypothetical protein
MFPAWRLQLRRARTAVADGRWSEAAALLQDASLREFLPAKLLSQDLAGRLLDRAEQRLRDGQSTAGWQDVNEAQLLGSQEQRVDELRRREAADRLTRAVERLARGDAVAARRELDRMDRLNLGGNERRTWKMIVEQIEAAEQHARRGSLPAAIAALEQARRQLPPSGDSVAALLDDRLGKLHGQSANQQALEGDLHRALAASDWSAALAAAQSLLELAPEHSAARQARSRAWQAVGMQVTQPYRGRSPLAAAPRPNILAPAAASTHHHASSAKVDTVTTDRHPGKRVVAWIDEVGAFLVCLGDEIVLGQPSPDGGVDVPILADLSRRHAVIRRESEAYVLVPLHQTALDGREIAEPTVLRDKSVIKLGPGVEIRFRKPHALSATATLELITRNRIEPAVDAVVLMSESCILGPHSHSHVRCRRWQEELVLFRRGDQLMCRTSSPVEVDGEPEITQAAVGQTCRIEGDNFALTLEEL